MAKYAKYQPVGFKNAIERVAIVGVRGPSATIIYTATLTNALRLEAQLARTLPTPFLKPENTQSQPCRAKTVVINCLRVS